MDFIPTLNQILIVLNWIVFPFATWGVVALAVEVIPRQLDERKIRDDITLTRNRLPILTSTWTFLAGFTLFRFAFALFNGVNNEDFATNATRIVILLMIFIKCLQWKLIYTDPPLSDSLVPKK